MPTAEELVERLKEVRLFSGLRRPELRLLAGLVKESEEFRPGQIICQQGEPGRRYFIIERGRLRVTRVDPEGRVETVRELGPGEAFGETSLLLGDVRDATVECVEPAVLLYIEKEDFDWLLEEEPRIERALRMRPDVAERRRYPRFSWLEEGELVIKVAHKHPAVLVPVLLIPGLLVSLLLIATGLAAREWGVLGGVLGGVLTMIPLGYALYLYADWRNDVYVVTNRRVAHRERTGLVRVQFAAAPLTAIQDVQQIQVGVSSRIWGYGDLIIETAGEAGQVVFRSVPQPDEIRRAIFEQISKVRAIIRARERAAIRRVIRRHFLHEGEEEETGVETAPAEKERPGCWSFLSAAFRIPFRGTWHREGATVTWHKHWVALIPLAGIPLLIFLLISALALAGVVYLGGRVGLRNSIIILYALASFIVVPWLLWQLEDWQNDYYQVTATRIIHVERLPFFLREERREARLEQITNVRFDQSFWGRLLRFGDVIVETAAPAGTFHFRMVHRPQDVQSEIFAHIEAARRSRQEREAKRHQAEMLDWFSEYDELRKDLERPSSQPQEETM